MIYGILIMPYSAISAAGFVSKCSHDPLVVIEVRDTKRTEKCEFICKKRILEKEMPYFRTYFLEKSPDDSYRVTVYSDLDTFKWLMEYINCKNEQKITGKNILQILISAEWLKMPTLSDRCIDYLCSRIDEVEGIINYIDNVTSDTWEKVARSFPADKLAELSEDLLLLKKFAH